MSQSQTQPESRSVVVPFPRLQEGELFIRFNRGEWDPFPRINVLDQD